MREIVCSRCGAVMVVATDVTICRHCGRDPRRSAWAQTLLLASNNIGFALWLLMVATRFAPKRNDWEQDAVFCGLLAAAGFALLCIRRNSVSSTKSFADLNLSAYAVPAAAEQESWSTIKPPEVPAEWAGLIGTPRPRRVYWPFWSSVRNGVPAAIIIGSFWLAYHVARQHHWSFPEWRRFWLHDPIGFIVGLVADAFLFLGIFREFSNYQLVREGDVTMGYLIDGVAEGSTGRMVHEFWTRNGERFQHRASLMSGDEGFSLPGVVPVFYMPEDPSKSVALSSTELRVRLPNQDFAERARQLDAGR
jgi:hypothetical protein